MMIKPKFRICSRYPFLECELPVYREGCLADRIDDEFGDNMEAVNELGLDLYNNGAVINSVFGDIITLKKGSVKFFDTNNHESSFRRFLEEKGDINPFPYIFTPEIVESRPYQMRGSGFQSYGPIGLFVSIVDDDKLEKETGEKIELTELLRIGTTRHTIQELDSVNIEALEWYGIEPAQPSTFTEISVEYVLPLHIFDDIKETIKNLPGKDKTMFSYDSSLIEHDEIALRGTIDAILRIGNTLVVMDWKRGVYGYYEKINNKLQFSSYAYGFIQKYDILEPDDYFKDFVLISVNRAMNALEGNRAKPMYHLTYLKRKDNFKDYLEKRMLKAYLELRELYENPMKFVKEMDKFEKRLDTMGESEKIYVENYFVPHSRTMILYEYLKDGGSPDKVFNDGIQLNEPKQTEKKQLNFKFDV